jgi:hypothetical protein
MLAYCSHVTSSVGEICAKREKIITYFVNAKLFGISTSSTINILAEVSRISRMIHELEIIHITLRCATQLFAKLDLFDDKLFAS